MKKIAIFNHKGGVAKTTTCYHLGWSLAQKGRKVLLVDADSQCNLTMYALGKERYESYYENSPENNIHYALMPAFKSKPILIQPVDCPEIRPNLFLLPGHLDFTENEMQLSVAMQLSSSFGSMENLPGAINYLVEQTAENFGIDYVLFDMNPSLSSINEDIFVCCDYFMIPTNPDSFSPMSIQSLGKRLPMWEKWAKRAREAFQTATYPLPDSHPKFLGYTVNNFNLSNGRPQYAFRQFMTKISTEIKECLVPALQQEGMTLQQEQYDSAYENMGCEMPHPLYYPESYCLVQISNFNRLVGFSHAQSRPVFVAKQGLSTETQARTQRWFKTLYSALANRVLRLMSDEP